MPPMPTLRPGVTLYFVRHGETDWNRVQRYQGQTDIPLNDTGRGQAARNGAALRRRLGEAASALDFVSSPQLRAAETMQILRRELGLPIEPFRRDPRLMEQHFGHWEGELYARLPEIDPEGFAARKADPWHWSPRGGESYVVLATRVGAWLDEIERDTLVTSHGNVSRAVRHLVLGLEQRAVTTMPVPQDEVLILRDGAAEWL
jgi:broad specificity phosphatase PhoE